ncbi:MAG: ABC transporter substrate-binding protein [Egibacteraceae bacterium]
MRRSAGALLALVALLAVACGGGQASRGEAGGDPIVIGAVFDLSGPTADIGTPYSQGVRDYVDWRNAGGGIAGRPIDLRWQDYRYEVPVSEQLYTQFVSEGAVAFQGWGTGDTEALRARVTADEIPFMSASYAATLTDPSQTPYNFVVGLSFSDQMRIALRYIASQAQGEHVEVAVLHQDGPFGASPLEDGRAYIAQEGLDIGYQTYVMTRGATDYVGELSRVAGQGARYVIVQNTSIPAATLARNLADQGIGARLFCLNACGDELLVAQAGGAAEGALGILPFAPPAQADGDVSDVQAFLVAKGSGLEDVSLHYTQGWYTMHVMAESIASVVESGGQVTGPAIRAALESVVIDTPVTTEIRFSPDSHAGMRAGRVYQVEAGVWVPASDALTP